jgi:uncharacterized lipoprotein YbaY
VSGEVLVRGRICFEPASPPFEEADIWVRLEDVSDADASGRIVAEHLMHGVSKPEGSCSVPFMLRSEASLESRRHYSVRVHVDVGRSGRVRLGDFVSTQAYPVRAGDTPGDLEILVRRVE